MSDLRPYLIDGEDAAGKMLNPLPSKHTVFQEQWLQEILFRHPSILPVEDIGESYAPLISVGREIANIDNLFVSPNGLLTIVETKLWRNPEAHRTVVAQILDYAKTLTTWDYAKLDNAVKTFQAKTVGQPRSLYEVVRKEKRDLDLDGIEFEQRVQDSLTYGRFALLIVGDRIFPAATQLVEVIQSTPDLQFSMALVELRCFRLQIETDWPLLVVPSIVARTREVMRAVVKVIYEEKKPEIEVNAIEEEPSRTGKTSLAEFLASLPSNLTDVFSVYLDRWTKVGYTVYWGEVGFSLRIPWGAKLVTVFDAYPNYISVFKDKYVGKHNLPPDPYRRYRSDLSKSGIVTTMLATGKRYIKYEDMSEDEVKLLLECTDRLAAAWFEAQSRSTT